MSNMRELSCRIAHILDLSDCFFMINIRTFNHCSFHNSGLFAENNLYTYVIALNITNIDLIPFHSVAEYDLSGEIL